MGSGVHPIYGSKDGGGLCEIFLSIQATTDACGSVHALMPAFKEVYPDVRHGFHSIRRELSSFVHGKAVK
jgi:hypothetical protein